MTIKLEDIKKLRDQTGLGISDCKKALTEASGDYKKALEVLKKRAGEIAAKKGDRAVGEGIIESYIHHNNKIGVLLELACETDFVAKNEEFKKLAHEIALQIAAGEYGDCKTLLESDFFKDTSVKIVDLIKEAAAKFGENIELKRFVKFTVGVGEDKICN